MSSTVNSIGIIKVTALNLYKTKERVRKVVIVVVLVVMIEK